MTLAPFFTRQHRGGGRQAMTPYRGDAYREMEDINRRFNQLIQAFFGDTTGLMGAGALAAMTPPVDIEETDDAYVVDIDLPNVRPEDVTIEMRGEELRVSGSVQQRQREGVMRRQSRPSGEFEYVVDLPSDIDPNRVEATYDNGVLTITVGKARDAQPRRIEVRHQQSDNGERPQVTQRAGDRGQQAATARQQQRQ
jgi:HSP20 family protein